METKTGCCLAERRDGEVKMGNLVWFGNFWMLWRFGNLVKWGPEKFADVESGGQAAYWCLLSDTTQISSDENMKCWFHLFYLIPQEFHNQARFVVSLISILPDSNTAHAMTMLK